MVPRLMARFANDGTAYIARTVTPNPDPLLPGTTTETVVEFNAVVRGVSSTIQTADPNLEALDLQAICAAIEYIPVVGQWVEINGSARLIVRVDAIVAAGLPAAYRFFLR